MAAGSPALLVLGNLETVFQPLKATPQNTEMQTRKKEENEISATVKIKKTPKKLLLLS